MAQSCYMDQIHLTSSSTTNFFFSFEIYLPLQSSTLARPLVPLNRLFLSFDLLFLRGLFQHTLFSRTFLVIMLVSLAVRVRVFPLLNFHHLPYLSLHLHHPFPILLLGYHPPSIHLTLVIYQQPILSMISL